MTSKSRYEPLLETGWLIASTASPFTSVSTVAYAPSLAEKHPSTPPFGPLAVSVESAIAAAAKD